MNVVLSVSFNLKDYSIGNLLFTDSNEVYIIDSWKAFHYDTQSPYYKQLIKIDCRNQNMVPTSIELSHRVTCGEIKNQLLYLGTKIGDILIVNLQGYDQTIMKGCHSGFITALCFQSYGNLISSGSDGFIRIWNNDQMIKEFEHEKYISCLSYYSDRNLIIAASYKKLYVYDFYSTNPLKCFSDDSHHNSFITSLLFVKQHKLVVSGDMFGKICFWKMNFEENTIMLQLINSIKKDSYIVQFKFLEDYNSILVISKMNRTELIKLDDDLKIFTDGIYPNFIHNDSCNCLNINNEKNLFVTGAANGEIKFWKINDD